MNVLNDLSCLTFDHSNDIKKGEYAVKIREKQLNYCISQYGCIIPPKSTCKPTLVLELDKILVHSSDTPLTDYDFIVATIQNTTLCLK